MGYNSEITSVYHISKADFLQRIRGYNFLISVGVCIFIVYSFVPPPDAGYRIVSLGNYRGFYNSAWVGSMVAMCVPFFTLFGFYLISDAVKRDIDTGVGQIIATTPVTKVQYLTGKFLSNFAVLMLMLTVIAVMTVVMFVIRGETSLIQPGHLLLPLLLLTVPAMFILASIALFFDSFTGLSRGFINIAFFFLWIFLVSSAIWSPFTDVFGLNTCKNEITSQVAELKPDWNGDFGTGIMITGSHAGTKIFTWEGMHWSAGIILQRIFWMAMAFGLVLLSSFGFNRFDTRESKDMTRDHWWVFRKKLITNEAETAPITIRYVDLPLIEPDFSFLSLVKAELRLMLNGSSRLWMIITSGLFIASVFTPLQIAWKYILPLLWFMQVLKLSKTGSREIVNRCNEYIFATARPLSRQLPATFSAATMIIFTLALPVFIRVGLSGDSYGIYAIATGAFFVPALALATGIFTGGSKLFEVAFTIMVYGILNGIPYIDFTGAVTGSRSIGITHYFLALTIILIILGFIRRKKQLVCGS